MQIPFVVSARQTQTTRRILGPFAARSSLLNGNRAKTGLLAFVVHCGPRDSIASIRGCDRSEKQTLCSRRNLCTVTKGGRLHTQFFSSLKQLMEGSKIVHKDLSEHELNGCDHTSTNAPDPIRTPKLSVFGRE